MRIKQKIKSLAYKILDRFLKPYLDAYFQTQVYHQGSPFEGYLRHFLLYEHLTFGDPSRVSIAPTAVLNNALLNVSSGTITIEDHVFLGHSVSILTGTHDFHFYNDERKVAIPQTGRDVIIRAGAWIASNATILGPCEIGEHAVIGAASLVLEDVPPYTVVAGVPAKEIRKIPNSQPSS